MKRRAKMNNLTIRIIGLLFLVISTGSVWAQEEEDTLKSGDVYIVREYQPRISDAYKLSNVPKLRDTVIDIKQNAVFKVKEAQAETNFETEPIKPAKMKGEPLNKLYRAYAMLGFGNNVSTRGELVLNSIRSRTWDYGFKAWHHGSSGNVPNRGSATFSDNKFDIYGQKFFYNKILSGRFNYDINRMQYYGFDPANYPQSILDDSLSKSTLRNVYQNIEPELKFKTYFKDSSKINSELNLRFANYKDRHQSVENNLRVDLLLDRYFDNQFADLLLFVDYNQFKFQPQVKRSIPEFSNTIFGFKPRLKAGQDNWKITLGIEGNITTDTVTQFFAYPELYAKYDLVEDLLIPYAGIRGGLKRNNYKYLTQKNPFLNAVPVINNRNERWEVYGGIKGQFSANSSYNILASHKKVTNMPLFINRIDLVGANTVTNQFDVVYDDMQITQLTGEFGLQSINRFSGLLRGDYFIYSLTNQQVAWHMPDFKVTLSGWYDLSDKLVFTADVIGVSKRRALSLNPADGEEVATGVYAKELGGIIDLNLGVEYFFTKRFTAFLRMYNLANQNYQFYNEYGTQGITFIGGVSYSFWGNKKKKK